MSQVLCVSCSRLSNHLKKIFKKELNILSPQSMKVQTFNILKFAQFCFWGIRILILRTGAVVELWRPQGWRTREHIGCHQSMGIRIRRSKMSRTSHVQAEWPVEFKRDFNVITPELSRVTLSSFWNLRIDPSNRYIRNQGAGFWAVQGRFLNRFNRGPWHRHPCHIKPVNITTDMKVSTSQL